MFALLMLVALVALGIAAILGWTADSRDDLQKLWPLNGTRPNEPIPAVQAPARHHAQRVAAPQPAPALVTRRGVTR